MFGNGGLHPVGLEDLIGDIHDPFAVFATEGETGADAEAEVAGFSDYLFRTYEIKKISTSYTDVPAGEILALFDSNNHLEIAMNQGNAAGLLGLDYKDLVRIEFH